MSLIVTLLAVFILKAVLALFLARRVSRLIAQIEIGKTTELAAKFLYAPLELKKDIPKTDFQWGMVGSSIAAYTGLLNRFSTIVSEAVLLVLTTLAFLYVNVLATMLILVYFLALISFIQFFWSRSLHKIGEDITTSTIQTTSLVDDVYLSFKEISVYKVESFFLNKISSSRSKLANSRSRAEFLLGSPRYIVETGLIVGVVAFVAWQVSQGDTVNAFVTVGVFLTGGVRMMASLLPMQNSLANISTDSQQAKLVLNLLEVLPERRPQLLQNDLHNQDLPASETISVELREVSYSYPGSSAKAVNNINLAIKPGSKVALVGASGAGKSTVADLLLGLLAPSSGEVLVNGMGVSEFIRLNPEAIGYVPQTPGLLTGTIAENIAFGISGDEIDRERLQKVINLAHLFDVLENLPMGADTSISASDTTLSGGQLQRIGIARALYRDPKILILDEATSALDAKSENLVSEAIDELGDDVTLVVIAHRLATVKNADEVFIFSEGQLAASGKFNDLVESNLEMKEFVELSSLDAK